MINEAGLTFNNDVPFVYLPGIYISHLALTKVCDIKMFKSNLYFQTNMLQIKILMENNYETMMHFILCWFLVDFLLNYAFFQKSKRVKINQEND